MRSYLWINSTGGWIEPIVSGAGVCAGLNHGAALAPPQSSSRRAQPRHRPASLLLSASRLNQYLPPGSPINPGTSSFFRSQLPKIAKAEEDQRRSGGCGRKKQDVILCDISRDNRRINFNSLECFHFILF